MRISVIIIAKNSDAMIRRCLESVAWADETVVVDSGSTDDTLDICREFGPQKNRALDAACGDWVFSIDTDEWVTPQLRDEIQATINNAAAAPAYTLPRSSSFCGRYMKHSGWWPDYVIRLFKRDHARFSEDLVHERLIVDGAIHK